MLCQLFGQDNAGQSTLHVPFFPVPVCIAMYRYATFWNIRLFWDTDSVIWVDGESLRSYSIISMVTAHVQMPGAWKQWSSLSQNKKPGQVPFGSSAKGLLGITDPIVCIHQIGCLHITAFLQE